MSVTSTCFKWVDLLETQFDKSWIELDTLLLQLEEDEDLGFLYTKTRRHVTSLASCFSQLSHKATVVFQNNAKLEAELVHLREELATTNAKIEQANNEKLYLATALQNSLAKNHKLQFSESEQNEENGDEIILETDVKIPSSIINLSPVRDSEICSRLICENERLRGEMIELESEMIGARLDNVYLDKELAGRIQQIQLLLAANTPAEVKEKMWSQIESEMCLQRSKTIAQMCRTKQEVRGRLALSTSDDKNNINPEKKLSDATKTVIDDDNAENCEDGENIERRGKQVLVLKNPADDLGMAILGGRDHNLPIIISEIFPNTALSRCNNRIKAGDIICSVNDEDFSTKTHSEAVNFLSSLRGQIHFNLKGSEDICEDDPSNLDYRFYKLFHPSVDGPRKEEGMIENISEPKNQRHHPGHAVSLSIEKSSQTRAGQQEMPSVHTSPRK